VYNTCMKSTTLTPADRTFLTRVSEATFTNPFSERRMELDRAILGEPNAGSWVRMVPKVIDRIQQKLAELDRGGPVKIRDFAEADRRIMETVFLFEVFHRYNTAFDRYIEAHLGTDHAAPQVEFSRQALGDLARRGFSQEAACRFFSLFFQIRRAFHFIFQGLAGECPSMRRLRENLWNHIFTCDIQLYEASLWNRMEDFSTLLLGPTGSGKGAAAAAIGRSGYIPFDPKRGQFAKPFTETFVSVNLNQYAETLLESELFGHMKGSFTGAVASYEGLLSLCGRHGSIFLDEIGDISPGIQLKLLKVLEERLFTPVGSHKSIRFHGRVIAATHHSLDVLRQEGKFRDDFYYRLCSDCIELPSLQQRIQESSEELDILIAHTVQWIIGAPNEALCQTVRDVIDRQLGPDYAWPGNVRELAQCIRRVIIRRDYCGDSRRSPACGTNDLVDQIRSGRLRAEDLVSRYCVLLYERLGSYEEVARRVDLDRRTVKRHVQRGMTP